MSFISLLEFKFFLKKLKEINSIKEKKEKLINFFSIIKLF